MVMLGTYGDPHGSYYARDRLYQSNSNDPRARAARAQTRAAQSRYGRSSTGYSPALENPYARTASRTTSSSSPLSPDAAEVSATEPVIDPITGRTLTGAAAAQARQDSAALERARADMAGQQWVGIEDAGAFIDQGLLPFLGYNAKAGNSAQVYQLPEYTVDMIGPALQRMTPEELRQFRLAGVQAGLYEDDDLVPSSYGPTGQDYRVMEMLMSRANYTKAKTWEQALQEVVDNPGANAPGAPGSGIADYTGPMTTRDIIYQRTSIDAGRSILRNTMRELIGREPTDAEVRSYVSALQRKEQSSPQITEQVSEMVLNAQGQQTGETNTRKVIQDAPVPQEVLRASVEEGNAGEKFTFQAQDYFSRLMEVI